MAKTKLQTFIEHWENCQECELSRVRNKIVIGRGSVPADIVLLGEAPGASEDTLGSPFVGPAGKLLDYMIRQAMVSAGKSVTYAMTNLVCCIPKDEDDNKTSEPPDEAVKACQPRLREFIELCNPRLLVAVGACARDWLEPTYKHGLKLNKRVSLTLPSMLSRHPGIENDNYYFTVDITHPAAILRANYAQKGFLLMRSSVILKNAIEECFSDGD